MCESDTPEEQRLTIAHEVAHFLVDYLLPRREVKQALGEGITEVLDGLRTATSAERAAAILSHVRLGTHVHLLPKPGAEEDSDRIVAHVEERADRLALEMVAPREHVRLLLQNLSTHEPIIAEMFCFLLATHFGLPAYVFDSIAQKMDYRRPISFLADVREALRRRQ